MFECFWPTSRLNLLNKNIWWLLSIEIESRETAIRIQLNRKHLTNLGLKDAQTNKQASKHTHISQPLNEVHLSIYFNHTNDPKRIPKYEFIWWHCGSWYMAQPSISLSKKKQFLIYDHMRSLLISTIILWISTIIISFTCLFICLSYLILSFFRSV